MIVHLHLSNAIPSNIIGMWGCWKHGAPPHISNTPVSPSSMMSFDFTLIISNSHEDVLSTSSEECKRYDGGELATSGTKNEMCDKARKEYVQREHPQKAMHKNDL